MRARSNRAWSLANPGNRAAREELTAALLAGASTALAGEGPLLDCGCGGGWLLEALAGAGVESGRLHGIDADPTRVEAVRGRVPGAEARVADATALPYADGSFDAVFFVVSLSSLGGAGAARAALAEARRALAPEGAILIYEPRVPNPFNRGLRRLRRADLEATGLRPVATRSLTLLPPLGRRLGPATELLHPRLSQVPALRSHHLIVCRRPAVEKAARREEPDA